VSPLLMRHGANLLRRGTLRILLRENCLPPIGLIGLSGES